MNLGRKYLRSQEVYELRLPLILEGRKSCQLGIRRPCVLILKDMPKIINVGAGMAERFDLEANINPLVTPDESDGL